MSLKDNLGRMIKGNSEFKRKTKVKDIKKVTTGTGTVASVYSSTDVLVVLG